ncbi:TetR/AcrR family transcriptional regulator [Streptomyces somaliensis]|uniref:TetR/AcrR family transcriptional regulator n=1 Tax=Streptomyces somaliensis TaxID=78355 RepID=UPI0020CBC258|nr:TetR/AcrR family transcriptional regulator [Streptomyces somaliensis]MCP9946074.1 TetR/AcrR family transcriptional regulator [Streptomyces somaliensis]MCP9960755.1 TetR/AcrR family transcriptional regulator [Streptomyces somaliensis]MCP9973543.1 TetR/AcrR family transcriptional regulator [Streptomyces somaliensis]
MPEPEQAAPRAPDASRRSQRSRRAVLDAALALVGEAGYARTTIEGIAARAGVGKQTIYRWWPSKAAVLLDAFLDLTGGTGGEAAAGLPDTGDLAADLKTVLRATVDELGDPRFEAPTRALTAAGVVDPELGARFVERLLEPRLRLYAERLAAAREAGQVRPEVDPRVALELFVGPLTHRWLLRTRPLTHAYADELVEYALHGIAPR